VNDFETLIASLAGAPALVGARCKSRWELWDETDDPEIVEYTRNQCLSCPALNPCTEYVESLKPSKRPSGVVCGLVWEDGRPKSGQRRRSGPCKEAS
jgi:WhiB family redox-sensing transcriptional regulator